MEADTEAALWEQARELLRHHQKSGDPTPVDALNRLFHEAAPKAKAVRLSEANCRIRAESRSTRELSLLHRRHSRANPRNETYPVLVARYGSEEFLIDGCNRINKWVADKNSGVHSVLVIEFAEAQSGGRAEPLSWRTDLNKNENPGAS